MMSPVASQRLAPAPADAASSPIHLQASLIGKRCRRSKGRAAQQKKSLPLEFAVSVQHQSGSRASGLQAWHNLVRPGNGEASVNRITHNQDGQNVQYGDAAY